MNDEMLPFYIYAAWYLISRGTCFAVLVHDERTHPGITRKLMSSNDDALVLGFIVLPIAVDIALAWLLGVLGVGAAGLGMAYAAREGVVWLTTKVASIGRSKDEDSASK